MRNINLKINGRIDYNEAERAARATARDMAGNISLFAWYDKARRMGAPAEACATESWKCVRDYAEHHEAAIRVSVNEDQFEFFYARAAGDAEELDAEQVTEVHQAIAQDEFNNVQGG